MLLLLILLTIAGALLASPLEAQDELKADVAIAAARALLANKELPAGPTAIIATDATQGFAETIAQTVGARVTTPEAVRTCSGTLPNTCRLVDAMVAIRFNQIDIQDNKARVSAQVSWMTGHEDQPVPFQLIYLALRNVDGKWAVVDQFVRAQS